MAEYLELLAVVGAALFFWFKAGSILMGAGVIAYLCKKMADWSKNIVELA